MKPEDLFRQLCAGLGAAAETQFDPETGKTLVELPLCYANGDPIALAIDRDGGITDNGRTLLRLNTRGQLARFEEEGGFADYLRGYAASRDGIAIRYMGKSPTDLIRFVEVLRDIELVTPAPREASRAFDDLVREAVRKQLESKVREKILGLDDVATILNPILTFSIRDRDGNPIQIPYYPHLGALDKRHYYVILSHADDSDTQRQNHINQKLGPCGLIAQDPNAGGRVQAIIPPSGYSAGDEKLIFGYTGQQPLRLDVKNIKPLVRSLTEQPGFFAAS